MYTTGNPYGIAEDIVFSMPCRSNVSYSPSICLASFSLLRFSSIATGFFHTYQGDGDYELVKDVIFDDFLRSRIKKVHNFL